MELTGSSLDTDESSRCGYVLEVPLTAQRTIDSANWRDHQQQYRVRRFWVGESDQNGHLVLNNKVWYFEYDSFAVAREPTFQLGREQFVVGEFIDLRDHGGDMHIFKVVEVNALDNTQNRPVQFIGERA